MTVRADTTVNVRGVTPADGSYQAGGGYRWLHIDCGGARLALHGDPADTATTLVQWAGLLLDGCDREGRAQVYRAAARLKNATVDGLPAVAMQMQYATDGGCFDRGDRVRVNDKLASNPLPAWSERVGREGIVLGSQPDPAVDGHTTIVHLDGDPYGDVVWFKKGTLDLLRPSFPARLDAEARSIDADAQVAP